MDCIPGLAVTGSCRCIQFCAPRRAALQIHPKKHELHPHCPDVQFQQSSTVFRTESKHSKDDVISLRRVVQPVHRMNALSRSVVPKLFRCSAKHRILIFIWIRGPLVVREAHLGNHCIRQTLYFLAPMKLLCCLTIKLCCQIISATFDLAYQRK